MNDGDLLPVRTEDHWLDAVSMLLQSSSFHSTAAGVFKQSLARWSSTVIWSFLPAESFAPWQLYGSGSEDVRIWIWENLTSENVMFSGRPLPGRIFWCQESWLWTFECKVTVWQVEKSREFQEVEKDHDTQSFVPSWSYRKGLDDSLAEGIGCGSRKLSRKLVGPVLISVLFACSMFTQCVCPVQVHRPGGA